MSLDNGLVGLFGIGLSAAGTATQSYASYQQAVADNMAAQWNANLMGQNAALQDIRAEQTLEAGRHNVAVARREGRLAIEDQRAGFAASGVKVDSGSALDVVAEQAGRNRYDQDMLRYNAELAAWGHRVEGDNLRQQAMLTAATKRSPWQAAGATLLSGGTSLFNQYSQYSQMYRK